MLGLGFFFITVIKYLTRGNNLEENLFGSTVGENVTPSQLRKSESRATPGHSSCRDWLRYVAMCAVRKHRGT